MQRNLPLVSVGMPVYNEESTLAVAINSILSQTIGNFELIISDNASTDGTEAICNEFAQKDKRIRFYRQASNIEALDNFKFVLKQSKGEFFMWAAADDIRTPGFIEKNLSLLNNNPNLVFTSAPNCFQCEEEKTDKRINFDIKGSDFDRFTKFLTVSWISHACFYSLIRRSALEDLYRIKECYSGWDWSVDVLLLSKGEFGRTADELLILGQNGESVGYNYVAKKRKRIVEYLVPFIEFSKFFSTLIVRNSSLSMIEKSLILIRLTKFNILFVLKLFKFKVKCIARQFFSG